MLLEKIEKSSKICAVIQGSEAVIRDSQSVLELLMQAMYGEGGILHSKLGLGVRNPPEICKLRRSHCYLWGLFPLYKQTVEGLHL